MVLLGFCELCGDEEYLLVRDLHLGFSEAASVRGQKRKIRPFFWQMMVPPSHPYRHCLLDPRSHYGGRPVFISPKPLPWV